MILGAEASTISTMAKLFAIAFVLVAPYGFVRIRRVLAERRRDSSLDGANDAGGDSGLEPGPPDLHSVEAAIAAIGRAETSIELRLPATVDGVEIEDRLAHILIDDVAQRDGVDLVWHEPRAAEVWHASVRRP